MKRGDVCVWNRRRPDGSISRILCTIANRTPKNVEIQRWAPRVKRFVKVWASPASLEPATEREKIQYHRLTHEWQQIRQTVSV